MDQYYKKMKSEKEIISYLHNFITEEKNMIFSLDEISNMYFSLKTQKLVILNSKPGMGKTELCNSYVEAFQQWFKEDTVKKIFIPINKEFDKTELLGYKGLDEKYYPSPLAKDLFELGPAGNPTKNNDPKLYFVILDEMNLSQIDFYFTELLAAIENNEKIILPNGHKVSLPDNCFFMGTINSFTYESSRNPVSGSVKRRANIINIKNPLDKIIEKEKPFQEFKKWINKIITQSKATFEKNEDFLNHFRLMNFNTLSELTDDNFYTPLFELTKSLSNIEENKLTFGILQDIIEYIIFSNQEFPTPLDIQIIQKILPLVSGSIKNLGQFESFLDNFNLLQSKEIFFQMKTAAEKNMGQIIPLC